MKEIVVTAPKKVTSWAEKVKRSTILTKESRKVKTRVKRPRTGEIRISILKYRFKIH